MKLGRSATKRNQAHIEKQEIESPLGVSAGRGSRSVMGITAISMWLAKVLRILPNQPFRVSEFMMNLSPEVCSRDFKRFQRHHLRLTC